MNNARRLHNSSIKDSVQYDHTTQLSDGCYLLLIKSKNMKYNMDMYSFIEVDRKEWADWTEEWEENLKTS